MTQILSAKATKKSGDFLAQFLRAGWKVCGAFWRKFEVDFWMVFNRVADSFLMNKCDFLKVEKYLKNTPFLCTK